MTQCLQCNEIFVGRKRKDRSGLFCSLSCYHNYQKKHSYQPAKVCPNCGETFIVEHGITKAVIDRIRFCSMKCAREGVEVWNKGLTKESDERVKKYSELASKSLKGRKVWNKGKTGIYSDETLRKIGEGSSKWIRTPVHLAKLHKGRREKGFSEDTKRKIGEKNAKQMKRLWRDPSYVLMQIQKRGVKPNKAEQKYIDYFKSNYADFKYNGDGRLGVVLSGLVPDFVNINGRKQVIEIFGEYFHSDKNKQLKPHQTEVGRIAKYKDVGFDCLVIWSLEINKPELVRIKMDTFVSSYGK